MITLEFEIKSQHLNYRKVASSSLSWLVAHFQIFRRLMKGKFDTYILWPLAKKFQNWIVDWSTARNFTVSKNSYNRIYDLYCNGFLVATLLPITLCIFLLYLAKAGIAIASPTPHPPFRRLCNVFIKSWEPPTPLGLINELKAIKFIFDLMTNHKLVKLFTLDKVQVFWKGYKNIAHFYLTLLSSIKL